MIALFFLNYRLASANNLLCFMMENYLFFSCMTFVKVLALVLACCLWIQIVFAAVSKFLKVEITWVQVATNLKFWVWHLFIIWLILLLQNLIKNYQFFDFLILFILNSLLILQVAKRTNKKVKQKKHQIDNAWSILTLMK